MKKLLLLLLLFSPVAFATDPLSAEKKQELIHLLKSDCGSCHGYTLKGGLGSALLPENLKNKSILLLKTTILNGREGTAMPPWKPLLTEQEAQFLAETIKRGLTP